MRKGVKKFNVMFLFTIYNYYEKKYNNYTYMIYNERKC